MRISAKNVVLHGKADAWKKGRHCHCPLVALMGVVWRSMALMGVIGRCGVVMIQRSSSATSVTTATNVSTTLRAASTLYCFNGVQGTCMPRRPQKTGRQPPLMQGSVLGSLREKLQMESTSIGRPQTLEGQRLVMVVRMVRMVSEVESVAHL